MYSVKWLISHITWSSYISSVLIDCAHHKFECPIYFFDQRNIKGNCLRCVGVPVKARSFSTASFYQIKIFQFLKATIDKIFMRESIRSTASSAWHLLRRKKHFESWIRATFRKRKVKRPLLFYSLTEVE